MVKVFVFLFFFSFANHMLEAQTIGSTRSEIQKKFPDARGKVDKVNNIYYIEDGTDNFGYSYVFRIGEDACILIIYSFDNSDKGIDNFYFMSRKFGSETGKGLPETFNAYNYNNKLVKVEIKPDSKNINYIVISEIKK